jgi:hypothetical protein
MPIPFIIAGAAVAVAGAGVKKGFDAHEKNKQAAQIMEESDETLKLHLQKFNNKQAEMEKYINDFARFKLMVFNVQIKKLIEFIKKCKKFANSEFDSENLTFTNDNFIELEAEANEAYEISTGLVKGATSGALVAFGTYGSVGALATASTGTAIGTLSGAAATNATLAWLGGGALSVGGGGRALGTAVLGGVVAAPLIAVTGFFMDSKAEKNLTAAHDYNKKVEIEIEKMLLKSQEFIAITEYIDELGNTMVKITDRFDKILRKINNSSNICEDDETQQLLIFGKAIKNHLDMPLLDKEGNKNINFKTELKRISVS